MVKDRSVRGGVLLTVIGKERRRWLRLKERAGRAADRPGSRGDGVHNLTRPRGCPRTRSAAGPAAGI